MIKDHKLLLVGALILTLIVFVLICAWLWSHNRKNINPVPIVADTRTNETASDSREPIHTSTVHIQADESLEQVLNDLIVRFESRYPNIQVTIDYTNKNALFSIQANDADAKGYLVDTDIIMADTKLAKAQIERLQALIDQLQNERNQHKQSQQPAPQTSEEADKQAEERDTNTETEDQQADNTDGSNSAESQNTQNNSESRTLSAFSYALQEQQSNQALEGIVLTENPSAVSFRNYVLSSTGQDILARYDYGYIDGYQKSIDDLFNPTTVDNKEPTVDVADALSNGK